MAGNRPPHPKPKKPRAADSGVRGSRSGQGDRVQSTRKIFWAPAALEDYRWWQEKAPRVAARIDALIAEILRSPFSGIGKPESLKHQFSGSWSRRISGEHRLVYRIAESKLEIAQCRYHY